MSKKTYQDIREELQKSPIYVDFQMIIPGLFIGPQVSAMKLEKMRANKITQVLKVNDTVKGFFPFEKMGIKIK